MTDSPPEDPPSAAAAADPLDAVVPGRTPVSLVLDDADRITAIDGDWDPVADADASPEARLIGTSLFDYVAGHFTRRFLRSFFASARESETPVKRPYRCDTPTMKRSMEMEAVAEPDGLRITHRLVAEEPLPYDIRIRAAGHPGTARYHRCSICNRLRQKHRTVWEEPEACAPRDEAALVIHTVCADCRRSLRDREFPMNLRTP